MNLYMKITRSKMEMNDVKLLIFDLDNTLIVYGLKAV